MRKSWDKYFLEMTVLVSSRATCERLKVGAVLVRDKRVIASGYNGSPSGSPHCIVEGCKVVDNHCVRTIHAEQNALFQCSKYGIKTEGATCYITHFPCIICAKSLIQAGITEVLYLDNYRNNEYVIELLQEAGVELRKVEL